jgi:cholesterol transport system auxiliary component
MRAFALGGLAAVLTGCGGFFESTVPAAQSYVLRLPAPAAVPEPVAAGALRVLWPAAGPGLNSDRIAVLRGDRRFDVYAATRWAAPAPEMLGDALVEYLRATGRFPVVLDDASPYLPHYNLRCGLTRFEADYTVGGNAPTVQVTLDCTFGRHRDRALLANFVARGSAPAGDDRIGAVVAAFETATTAAAAEIDRQIAAALDAEKSASP